MDKNQQEQHTRSYIGSPDQCQPYSVFWLWFELQHILNKISGSLVAFSTENSLLHVLEKELTRAVRLNQKLSAVVPKTVEGDC